MAIAREVRNQIKSIKNTQKITRAMEMVAASKIRRVQERMATSRPYAEHILQVISHLAHAETDISHTFLQKREVKRVGYIIITTDRGLCGGLNVNLLKKTLQEVRQWQEKGIEVDLCPMGSKGEAFFRRYGGHIVAKAGQLGEQPSVAQLIGLVKVMLDAYRDETIDALYLAYNQFVNTMTQEPVIQQLLPLPKEQIDRMPRYAWDYIYEPNAAILLDTLLTRYLEAQIYQGVVENLASEQAARMVAMKSASDNAGELINQLQLVYNKARQAAITQELSEIVAGAAAV